jgi:hypothetical protein
MDKSRWIDPGVARIILHAQELNLERDEDRRMASRRMRARTSTATMMMGSASLALAIVMVMVTLTGFLGISFASLSASHQVWVEAKPTRLEYHLDPQTNKMVSEPALVAWGRICLPSAECAWAAVMGLALGLMGIALSSRRREFSWSSAIGITLILLMLVTANVTVFVLRLGP